LIGTTNITGSLQVTGSVVISGSISNPGPNPSVSNEIFGAGAYPLLTGSARNTTVMGAFALGSSTGVRDSTVIGYAAMFLTTGSVTGSIAIGNSALYNQQSGSFNIAIGNSAMIGTTGVANIGDRNLAIGASALRVNTSGTRNNSIGDSSLQANSIGSYNVANGNRALALNTSGSYNVAVGYDTLFTQTSASNNTAVGTQALRDVTTGFNNTAIGYDSGRGITTGQYNTILGANVIGLAAGLSNNVIIADSQGNIRAQHDSSVWSLRTSTTITGSLDVSAGITGSLLGTASYATNALSASYYGGSVVSASYAATASYVLSAVSASYSQNSTSASFTTNATSASYALTSSYVNTLNQNVLITGSATIGAASAGASENTLTLGARDTANEGGQLGFNAPGGTWTSASFLDNWSNQFRILRGNNTTSDGLVAQWNLHTKQMQLPAYTNATSFVGTATANLAVDSSGNVITVSTSGGTVFPYTGNAVITGSLTTTGVIYAQPNGGMYFQGGDDAALYDINVANTMGIYGMQTVTEGAIKLGSNGPTLYGSGSRLGIGTTTPTSASLTVSGNVWANSFTGSLLGTSSYAALAATASYAVLATTASYFSGSLSAPGSTTQILYNNGGTIAGDSGLVYSGSNVGIGTTSPSQKLDVNGYITSDRYYPKSSNNTFIFGDTGGLVITGSGYFYVPAGGGSYFENTVRFRGSIINDSNTYLTIGGGTSGHTYFSGNVGIGVATPQKALDVVVSANDFSTAGATGLSVGQWAGVHFGYRENNNNYRKSAIVFERTDLTSNNAQGKVHILNGPQAGAGSATLADSKLTIDEAGNVGIGTTNPGQKLQVEGSLLVNAGSSATAYRDIMLGGINGWDNGESHGIDTVYNTASSPTTFSRIESHFDGTNGKIRFRNLYNAGAPRTDILMTIQGNGNVGIGTDSPISKLQVIKGSQSNTISVANSAAYIYGADVGIAIGQDNGAGGYGTWIQSMRLSDNASFPMSLNANGGNVGIGTIDPAAKLDIKGNLIISSSLIANQNTASLASGAQTISTNATSSYTAAFYNYTLASGSNARAGQVTAVWNGGSIQYTDVSTTDIGSTLAVAFTASLSGGNVQLTTVLPTSGWTVKTLANLI
jgi:hypothetical protein